MQIDIRPEKPGDEEAIASLVAKAFATAPHSSGAEAEIVRCLREAGALTVSLVACAGQELVGQVSVSPVSLSDGAPGWFGLGPVAVKPAWQGRGIGARLVREALGCLQTQGASGCVVLGEPSYYGRFGFRLEAGPRLDDVPPGYFQALAFDAAQCPEATVRYHPAFSVDAP